MIWYRVVYADKKPETKVAKTSVDFIKECDEIEKQGGKVEQFYPNPEQMRAIKELEDESRNSI